jgi:hypothetical protein
MRRSRSTLSATLKRVRTTAARRALAMPDAAWSDELPRPEAWMAERSRVASRWGGRQDIREVAISESGWSSRALRRRRTAPRRTPRRRRGWRFWLPWRSGPGGHERRWTSERRSGAWPWRPPRGAGGDRWSPSLGWGLGVFRAHRRQIPAPPPMTGNRRLDRRDFFAQPFGGRYQRALRPEERDNPCHVRSLRTRGPRIT